MSLNNYRYSFEDKKTIIEWDIHNWSKSLTFFDQRIDFHKINNAMELGARGGGLTVWLALNGVQNIICSDYVDNTKTASLVHQKYPQTRSVTYQTIDATHIPYENHFDVIVFKSMLGSIGGISKDSAQQAIFEIYKALKDGGKLVFAENLEGSFLHKLLRRKFIKWSAGWYYFSTKDLLMMTRVFKKVEYRTVGFFGAFVRSPKIPIFIVKIFEVLDDLLAPLIPKRFRYIAFFVCEK